MTGFICRKEYCCQMKDPWDNINSLGALQRDGERGARMAQIDVDALRDHMADLCGTAAFSGFPAALIDLAEIERMSDWSLCQKAESLGVDLREFEVC